MGSSPFSPKLCRLCLIENVGVIVLFPQDLNNTRWPLLRMIREDLSISVKRDDPYPKQICRNCVVRLQSVHSFKLQCQENQKRMKEKAESKGIVYKDEDEVETDPLKNTSYDDVDNLCNNNNSENNYFSSTSTRKNVGRVKRLKVSHATVTSSSSKSPEGSDSECSSDETSNVQRKCSEPQFSKSAVQKETASENNGESCGAEFLCSGSESSDVVTLNDDESMESITSQNDTEEEEVDFAGLGEGVKAEPLSLAPVEIETEVCSENARTEDPLEVASSSLYVHHIKEEPAVPEMQDEGSTDAQSCQDADEVAVKIEKNEGVEKDLVERHLTAADMEKMKLIIQKNPRSENSDWYRMHKFLFQDPYLLSIKCKYCQEKIEAPIKMYECHLTKEHSASLVYPCDICGTYLSMDVYISHWCDHHMKHRCSVCNKHFASDKLRIRHEKMMHASKVLQLACDICGVKFRSEEGLQTHINFHKTQEEYTTEFKLEVIHYAEKHGNRASERFYGVPEANIRYWRGQKRCFQTGKRVSRGLRRDELTQILELDTQFVKLKKPTAFVPFSTKYFYCDICRKIFSNEASLKAHAKEHGLPTVLPALPTVLPINVETSDARNEDSPEPLSDGGSK